MDDVCTIATAIVSYLMHPLVDYLLSTFTVFGLLVLDDIVNKKKP